MKGDMCGKNEVYTEYEVFVRVQRRELQQQPDVVPAARSEPKSHTE